MITVRNVSKNFGGIKAIDNISFEVTKGEILGFLGPNGAGKTTTMRILTGYFPPSWGEVFIGKLDVSKFPIQTKKKIGYLAEDAPLYNDMITKDFLMFAASVKGVKKSERKKHIDKIIDLCGLPTVANRYIGKLSKGFRQRIALAQALTGEPEILILDEPTTGLDPKQIIEIRQLIKSLKGKMTIIISTHILPEVSMVSDRVIIINDGKLIASGSPGELGYGLKKIHEIIASIEGDERVARKVLESIDEILSVELISKTTTSSEFLIYCKKGIDLRSEIARAIVESGLNLLELKVTSMSLEDVFLRIVTKEEAVL